LTPDPGATILARQSIARHLAAIDALGLEWSSADQIRYVRTALEHGIDALQRADDARFDFLADCAMLAGQNMQDARLHFTDERLRRLENPESDATVGSFFLELGIILALELVVVATATYAVPALIAFAAAGARSQAVRSLTDVASVGAGLERAVAQRAATSKALDALATVVADREAVLLQVSAQNRWNALPTQEAMQSLGLAQREYAVGLAAHESSLTLVEAVHAAIDAAAGSVPPSLTSAQLQELLDGALANTTVGRVAEQIATDDVVRELLSAPQGEATGAPGMFQTSELVGRFLESNERARAEAADQWAELRFHIRVLPDAAFVASEITQQLLWSLHADPPPPGGPGPRPDSADGQTLVRGMEVVLWLAWMRQIQALGQRFITTSPTPVTPLPHEGRVWMDMFVTSIRGVVGFGGAATFVDGIRYPGLVALADDHAQYLYGQFAREFFVRTPDACPAPLEFDAARYDTVDTLPEGQERTDRLAEMKLLTIVFFQTLEADPAAIGSGGDPLVDRARETLRMLLGLEPEHDIVAEFLASQPPISVPDAELPEQTRVSEPAEDALAAYNAERVARDDLTKLATMITDLDLLISQFPSEPIDSSAGLVERFAAEDLKQAIADKQQAVATQYETFVEHAAGQPALVDEFDAEYATRLQQLRDWPPPAPQLSSPPTS
jgi:hypothetical protein